MSAMDASAIDAGPASRTVQQATPRHTSRINEDSGLPEYETEMSFWDFVDVINPLQHIPVVGQIYRAVTGDQISAPASVMGGILFGGPLGGAMAIANAVIEQSTGHDITGNALVALGLEEDDAPVQTAQATLDRAAQTATAPSPAPQGPAAPATAAGQSPAALPASTRPTASAMPPAQMAGAASAALTASTGRPASVPPNALSGAPQPTKMPARDTIPANTLQAKHAAALNAQQLARFAPPSTTPPAPAPAAAAAPATVPASSATAAASPTTAPAAPAPAPAPTAAMTHPGYAGAVSPDMMPDIMMRNLAKYEQARRAAARKATGGTDVSG